MKVIVFHEKYNNRVFVYNNPEELRLILAQVAQERLAEGYWYDAQNGDSQMELLSPLAHLSDAERIGLLLDKIKDPSKRKPGVSALWYLKQVEVWMNKRRTHEYENYTTEDVEPCIFGLTND